MTKGWSRRREILLLVAALVAAVLACSTVTGALDSGSDQETDPSQATQTAGPESATAKPSPTPTAIGPLPSGFEQTGTVEAKVDGQRYTWYTFQPPDIADVAMNSAAWSLQGGSLGTYKGVVALAGAFEGDTAEPKTAIYIEFPFKDEGAPFELAVPANPLEPAANIILHLESGDYKMTDGQLMLTDVSIQGEDRGFSGTFEGTLAASDSEGTLDELNTIELTEGRMELKRVDGDQAGG
ncbi:MAG: hypothetical protein WBR18_09315 [Anaerolineales bacterium]